jgi:hypothetical protein
MNIPILVAIIGAISATLAAILGHFFTRRREVKLAELKFKLDLYLEFLSSATELGSGVKRYESRLRFSKAVNTMNVVASKQVLIRINHLLDHITRPPQDDDSSAKTQDDLLRQIVFQMRSDLGQVIDASESSFKFRTISPGLPDD